MLDGLVVKADEDKSERINLCLFSGAVSEPLKLTNADYIYAFTQSDDGRTIAYTARYGSSDHSEGCLELLKIGDDQKVARHKLLCDSASQFGARLNWWADLRFGGQDIIITALADGDRNKSELYRYSIGNGASSLLLKGHGASWLSVIPDWESEKEILYVRDQELFHYDLEKNSTTRLRKFENSIDRKGYGVLLVGEQQYVFIITKDFVKTKFEIFILQDKKLVKTDEFVSQMSLSVVHASEDKLILFKQSAGPIRTVKWPEKG